MNFDYEKVYEGYTRDAIEDAKWQMSTMTNDQLKARLEKVYPKDFLETHGLVWKDARDKIAAVEILQERGLTISLPVEKYKSTYEGYARDAIEDAKWQMSTMTNDQLKARLEKVYPKDFLETHGLVWKDARDKIAATEILYNRKNYEESASPVRK